VLALVWSGLRCVCHHRFSQMREPLNDPATADRRVAMIFRLHRIVIPV
jgi:hypothetical protein